MTQARSMAPNFEIKFANQEVSAGLSTTPSSDYLNALTWRAALASASVMAHSVNNALWFTKHSMAHS